MGKVIGTFNKNSSEEVRICIEEFEGHWLLKVELYPLLKEAVDRLGEVLVQADNSE